MQVCRLAGGRADIYYVISIHNRNDLTAPYLSQSFYIYLARSVSLSIYLSALSPLFLTSKRPDSKELTPSPSPSLSFNI